MARAHARATLACWGLSGHANVIELIVTEMVTNAVAASAGLRNGPGLLVIRVCMITDGDVLTVEVWDQAPGIPVLRPPAGLAESGRGLAIIDELTGGRWGSQPAVGQPGKCTWAEVPLRDAPAQRFLS